MPDDLFAAADEAKRERLRALGWKLVRVHGTDRWEHPETRAWYREADAFAWLEGHDREHTAQA